ncbi:5-methylcytosine restriction system specificity protein McrC [Devosia salina]|uniref:Restriction endonuclease n=1 Tax=Devosia salina TaxID=2860336 RepID=A0ABX8WHI1_9HYPH|nr:hypothetical protein [Devosia salina]QYO78338.1 hypothetical protein K1X15_07250 [Devosia salina]
MLALADENYDRVLPILRSYERTNASPPHHMLARGFCHYLRLIVDLGLARGYYREPYTGFFKPKVEFGTTVARHLARGDELNVAGAVFAFSANLPVNAVLKSACMDFLRLIPRDQKWSIERRLFLEALNALYRVPAAPMRFGEQVLAEGVPRWIRDHYRGALTVYAMLLGYTQVGFGYDAQGSEMPSFLFSLDDIFESFVRNTLRDGLREAHISVVDGNKKKHQRPLFRDNKVFPIKPDAIMRRDKKVLGIGEVKYKPKIDESDRYQVISHAVSLEAPVAFWISPALSAAQAGMNYVGAISTGTKFHHYRLDISGDIDASRQDMVEKISALLPT